MSEPNFIECDSVEKANLVDISKYRFESYSESRGVYIFIKRRGA